MTFDLRTALEVGNKALLMGFCEYRQTLQSCGMRIGPIFPLKPTEGKNYFAESQISLQIPGKAEHDLVLKVLAFASGDGTGDATSMYKPGDLEIPERYQYREHPERVFPRSKEGVFIEAMLPLFSVNGNGQSLKGVVCLEELSPDNQPRKTLSNRSYLGMNKNSFKEAIKSGRDDRQAIELTTGYRRNGRRFGDPHSIHYASEIYPEALQFVAFLTITDPKNPVCNILREVAMIPQGL